MSQYPMSISTGIIPSNPIDSDNIAGEQSYPE